MKKLKNVVFVSDYAYYEGGAANVAIDSVLAFSKFTDLNIYLFCGSGEPCEQLLNSRARVISLKMHDLLSNRNRIDAFLKGIYNYKSGKELKKLLLTLNKEETIVHIHTWTKVLSSSVFKVCKDLDFVTYLTIHEYFLACPNGACYDFTKHDICDYYPLSFSCIKCNCDSRNYLHKLWRVIRQIKQNNVIRKFEDLNYIFISSFQKEQLLRRLPHIKNSYLIKNPINVVDRHKVDVKNNCKYIYIGRLSDEKGPRLFCEAITKANVKGVVIGSGMLFNELSSKYLNIEFTGWLNKKEIEEKLNNARALIFPSKWYEGSPLTVPEVQALGIPCIVTNCSSATDDIVNGLNGKIVSPTVDEIVRAIRIFEDAEYIEALSSNTFKMFDNNRCSKEYYVKNLMNLYRRNENE